MSYPPTPALPLPVVVAAERPPVNARVVSTAAAALVAGSVYLNQAVSWRQAALFLVGAFAGLVLYHAAFGFTSAFRVFLADRRGAGLRAQMLMLALAFVLFLPGLSNGEVFGQAVRGSTAPLGVPVIAGAFLFAVGMQLGGG